MFSIGSQLRRIRVCPRISSSLLLAVLATTWKMLRVRRRMPLGGLGVPVVPLPAAPADFKKFLDLKTDSECPATLAATLAAA